MSKAERSDMPVMMPGSAIGRTNSSDRRHLEREIKRRPDVGALRPGDAEPFGGVARGRKLKALLFGSEGIKQDQGERQMQEQQPADSGDA